MLGTVHLSHDTRKGWRGSANISILITEWGGGWQFITITLYQWAEECTLSGLLAVDIHTGPFGVGGQVPHPPFREWKRPSPPFWKLVFGSDYNDITEQYFLFSFKQLYSKSICIK